MSSLLEPLGLGTRTARNRVVFGPHETNLGRRRAISDRHVAYYQRRAAGGAGVIVVEEAAVHVSDWPYERSPLAADAGPGWAAVSDACRVDGALVLAAIGHSGGQGSSAYSQAPLWAPSRVPEVNSREVPKWMEAGDISAVVEGFGAATALAIGSGLDGVEVNAGQHSLVRQFLSGLTNQRDDEWGGDRLRFATSVLRAVRAAAGEAIVGLRLCCDELAPWAGITPESAPGIAAALAEHVDYVAVVRGSIFSVSATRPDGHVEPGFNLELARSLRAALPERVVVIAQGSIVDADQADGAIDDGACDAVEMTRAQLADPDLVVKLAAGQRDRIRPCILCNQTCQVRDARNAIVTCVVEPRTGHERDDPPVDDDATTATPSRRGDVLVVGGGVAGLECARVAASAGHRVTVAERSAAVGGATVLAARGAGRGRLAAIVDWLVSECTRLGVNIETEREVIADDVVAFAGSIVLCTGSRPGRREYNMCSAAVLTAAEILAGAVLPEGPVVVWDPIGGPIGVSVAERLRRAGGDVSLVTPDLIAGNELSRSGDLAPANVRLQQAGVTIERRSLLREVTAVGIDVEDRFTGARRTIAAAVVVDAGHRLPDDALWHATGGGVARAGDAIAPRTIHEAILEGRRRAQELDG
ncbi:MAG: mycofactocin system FadH/OYE family oxidoreductase 1 [Acidimicrobiales bacterium]